MRNRRLHMYTSRRPMPPMPSTCRTPSSTQKGGRACLRGRTLITALASAVLVAAGSVQAAAQQGAGAGNGQGAVGATVRAGGEHGAVTPPNAAAFEPLKDDLRRLVSANEIYHAKNGHYSSSTGALPGYHPTKNDAVKILSASATGWAGEATAPGLPGKSCVIYVGTVNPIPRTEAEHRSPPEAVVACDGA